ncbi:MAG: FixH family protein [Acidobacteriota bacterium]|nr:FixH family protein [Acidobacteriota bacterium]
MRLRRIAVATILALLAFMPACKSSDLPPNPTSLIVGTRDRLNPFRMTMTTDPQWPKANGSFILKVHVVDAAGEPATGVNLKGSLSMNGMSQTTEVTFDERGNGDYEAPVTLEMPGVWDASLTASKGDKIKQLRLIVEVGN